MILCLINPPHTTVTSTHTKSTQMNEITNRPNPSIDKTNKPTTVRSKREIGAEISKFLAKRCKNVNGEEIEEAAVVVEVLKALVKVRSQI